MAIIDDLVVEVSSDLDDLSAEAHAALETAMNTNFSSPELRARSVRAVRVLLDSIARVRQGTEPVLITETIPVLLGGSTISSQFMAAAAEIPQDALGGVVTLAVVNDIATIRVEKRQQFQVDA